MSTRDLSVAPITLHGTTVRLEPLEERHAGDLFAAADDDTFLYMLSLPQTGDLEGFQTYVRDLTSHPDYVSLAMVLRETERAIGMSSYLDIRPPHRGLEIGNTWIGRAWHGTEINPEAKYLMLRHAFEDLGAVRVQLKTDGRNLHSQAAIAKLGAAYEGILRRHIVLPDGFIRDTVMYSITDEEWPEVKARLIQRLGYVPGSESGSPTSTISTE